MREFKLAQAQTDEHVASKKASSSPAFDADALFREHKNSAVNIFTIASVGGGNVIAGGNFFPQTLGSGFVIDANKKENFCRVATDNHTAKDGNPLKVRMSDDREYDATIEFSDPANDLAILKVSGVKNMESVCKPVPIVADQKPVAHGDKVVKISMREGSPTSAVGTVDTYFVRNQAPALRPWQGENTDRTMLFANGPADTGDSGAMVLTKRGVIGIQDANTPDSKGMGITPSSYLKDDLDRVKKQDK
jgi:serine protease Do